MEMTQTEIAQFSADQIRALVLFEYSYRGEDITSLGTSVLDKMLDHKTDEEIIEAFRKEVEGANEFHANPEKARFHRKTAEAFFELIISNLAVSFRFDAGCGGADSFLSEEEFAAMNKFYDEQEELDAQIYEAEAETRVQAAMDSFGDLDQHRKEDGSLPYYVTARLMAASEDPDDPSGMDWDMWKDEMKEGAFY